MERYFCDQSQRFGIWWSHACCLRQRQGGRLHQSQPGRYFQYCCWQLWQYLYSLIQASTKSNWRRMVAPQEIWAWLFRGCWSSKLLEDCSHLQSPSVQMQFLSRKGEFKKLQSLDWTSSAVWMRKTNPGNFTLTNLKAGLDLTTVLKNQRKVYLD